jgi:hypothetical protein
MRKISGRKSKAFNFEHGCSCSLDKFDKMKTFSFSVSEPQTEKEIENGNERVIWQLTFSVDEFEELIKSYKRIGEIRSPASNGARANIVTLMKRK